MWALLAAVLLVLAPAPRTPALTDERPCGNGFDCATLAVPLDRGGKLRGSLRLAVAGNDLRSSKPVLLFLAGGPGQPLTGAIERISGLVPGVREQYRVVALDQRGTGATALDCPALQAQMGASDLYPPTRAAVAACAASLGARRSLYGTDDTVADIDDLRRALGAATISLDGISYGSYVAERYALAHPRNVAKLVLDSVVPHTGDARLVARSFPEVARVLRAVCAARSCPTDPAADLAATVRRTHEGVRLLDAITGLSVLDPTFQHPADLMAVLHDAARGGSLDSYLAQVHRYAAVPADELSQGLHAAALCGDWRFPWGDASSPPKARAAALARYGRSLKEAALWPFDRATATGNGVMQQCLWWPATAPTPAAQGKLPDVPTLLLAGDRDLSTPLPWARAELALAPGGRLVVVAGAGHSVQSRAQSSVGREAVAQFLLG